MQRRRSLCGLGISLSLTAVIVGAACQPAPAAPTAASSPRAGAGTAAATTPAGAATGVASPSATRPRGTVRFGAAALPASLDPIVAINVTQGAEAGFALGETLVEVSPDGAVLPVLASAWTTSADGLNWSFTLRPDLKFSDGSPLTASDVKFTVELVKDPANRYSNAGRLATTTAVAAPDARTVVFTSNGVDAIYPRRLTSVPIISQAAYRAAGSAQRFAEQPVAAGQFRVKVNEIGKKLTLEANPFSWRPPKVATIEFAGLGEPITRVTALQTGEVNISNQIQPAFGQRLKDGGFMVNTAPTNATTTIILDRDSPDASPLLRDIRVRRALTIGLDRPGLIAGLTDGYGAVGNQAVNPAVYGFNSSLPPIPFQQDEARRLIQEAGANGASLKIGGVFAAGGALTNATAVQAIQAAYERIGLKVEISPSPDVASFQQKFSLQGGLEPLLLFNLTALASDADGALAIFRSFNNSGVIRYRNADFDRAYQASITEIDPTRRKALLEQAIKVMYDDYMLVPVGYLPVLYANDARTRNVKQILGFRFVWSDITVD